MTIHTLMVRQPEASGVTVVASCLLAFGLTTFAATDGHAKDKDSVNIVHANGEVFSYEEDDAYRAIVQEDGYIESAADRTARANLETEARYLRGSGRAFSDGLSHGIRLGLATEPGASRDELPGLDIIRWYEQRYWMFGFGVGVFVALAFVAILVFHGPRLVLAIPISRSSRIGRWLLVATTSLVGAVGYSVNVDTKIDDAQAREETAAAAERARRHHLAVLGFYCFTVHRDPKPGSSESSGDEMYCLRSGTCWEDRRKVVSTNPNDVSISYCRPKDVYVTEFDCPKYADCYAAEETLFDCNATRNELLPTIGTMTPCTEYRHQD